jgi:iron complex transport system substrate-binding protein
MAPRVSLTIFVVAVGAIAVWVQARTPAALLPDADRPDRAIGAPPVVQIGPRGYPRVAVGADGVAVTIASPPRRIVSAYWSADEFLYGLVPPARIVGVSETAYSQASSNVLPFVTRFHPVIATEVEHVLRANPDLVLVPDSQSGDIPAVLRAAGLPVYRLYTRFETLQSIEDHLRLFGYLSGEDERAATAVTAFRAAIARGVLRRPPGGPRPRVLGMGGGYSYGSRTLFNDVLRVLGAENLAATHGFSGYDRVTDEQILQWDPDWIIAGADRGKVHAVRASLVARPAIAATSAARAGRVIVLENSVFLPMSPYTARLVEVLAEILYGGSAR